MRSARFAITLLHEGFIMRLERRLRRMLKKRGYRMTEAVRESLRDFIATVSEQNPDVVDAVGQNEDEDENSADKRPLKHSITCPHCGEAIPIAIDVSGDDQDDVQDCTVCCSPIHVAYSVRNGQLHAFHSEPY